MKKGSGKKPECHPNRKHYAKGLCAACYAKKGRKKKENRKVKHEPVRVIHTHEVIRAVRQQEEHKMAAEVKDEKETKRDTVPGYAGVPSDEASYPAPKYATDLPEGSVISPLGITRPPEVSVQDPYLKERSDDEQLAGKVLIKGKTHHGFKYERIVDVLQPRTELGMFQIFKAHFPDGVEEDFSAKPISDEDAEKLEKEWAQRLQGNEPHKKGKKNG